MDSTCWFDTEVTTQNHESQPGVVTLVVTYRESMWFYIYYDELSYIYEPHGTQEEAWSTTLEGSEILKASGWKPFEMHRVSRHLHLGLVSGGHLSEGC